MSCQNTTSTHRHSIDRRTTPEILGCGRGAVLSSGVNSPVVAQTHAIKFGYVSPLTGPLAAFADADNFILANFKEAIRAGIKIGNNTVPVEVVVKDTGMIGALIYLQKARISPEAALSVLDWTTYVIFITVIGGIGRWKVRCSAQSSST